MEAPHALEPVRYIGDDTGAGDRDLPDGLTGDGALDIYRAMVLLRAFDERAVALQRQGRIGTYPPFWGEEATQAGPLFACADEDWLFPSYRQNAIGILRGVPASAPLKYRRGFGGEHGFWNPRRHRVAPICIPIGTHLPHAVGLAWAARLRGDVVASLVWFGDGATSEGDFHEAMNFASVFKTPTVFFCVNNQWAISTPFHKQTATQTIAEKAVAYAMPSVRVDGFDAIACWATTRDALLRARSGAGPSLIEAHCYRIGPHATADDPSRYRDESAARDWRKHEPVAKMAGYLKRRGTLDDVRDQQIHDEATETIAAAVTDMESVDPPSSDVLFDYVYAGEKPWTLSEGAAELDASARAKTDSSAGAPWCSLSHRSSWSAGIGRLR